jgi:hypothetical protein
VLNTNWPVYSGAVLANITVGGKPVYSNLKQNGNSQIRVNAANDFVINASECKTVRYGYKGRYGYSKCSQLYPRVNVNANMSWLKLAQAYGYSYKSKTSGTTNVSTVGSSKSGTTGTGSSGTTNTSTTGAGTSGSSPGSSSTSGSKITVTSPTSATSIKVTPTTAGALVVKADFIQTDIPNNSNVKIYLVSNNSDTLLSNRNARTCPPAPGDCSYLKTTGIRVAIPKGTTAGSYTIKVIAIPVGGTPQEDSSDVFTITN